MCGPQVYKKMLRELSTLHRVKTAAFPKPSPADKIDESPMVQCPSREWGTEDRLAKTHEKLLNLNRCLRFCFIVN